MRALTERLPAGQAAKLGLAQRNAADVMTPDPVVVRDDALLIDAMRLLLAHKVKRLPVVDNTGKLIGLVGRGKILQELASEL